MSEGKNALTDEARQKHIEEMALIKKQIKQCENKHFYTQAKPLRKKLAFMRKQLSVFDRELGY